jgi:hypothetical protein
MEQLEIFKEKFGYGMFRKINGGYEVRVKDLDKSKEEANRVIRDNNLSLVITSIDVRLRSFDIKLEQK